MKSQDSNWLWKPDKWTRVCLRSGEKKVREEQKRQAQNYHAKPPQKGGNG